MDRERTQAAARRRSTAGSGPAEPETLLGGERASTGTVPPPNSTVADGSELFVTRTRPTVCRKYAVARPTLLHDVVCLIVAALSTSSELASPWLTDCRNVDLASCCLVSHDWGVAARRLLYGRVALKWRKKNAMRLLRTLDANPLLYQRILSLVVVAQTFQDTAQEVLNMTLPVELQAADELRSRPPLTMWELMRRRLYQDELLCKRADGDYEDTFWRRATNPDEHPDEECGMPDLAALVCRLPNLARFGMARIERCHLLDLLSHRAGLAASLSRLTALVTSNVADLATLLAHTPSLSTLSVSGLEEQHDPAAPPFSLPHLTHLSIDEYLARPSMLVQHGHSYRPESTQRIVLALLSYSLPILTSLEIHRKTAFVPPEPGHLGPVSPNFLIAAFDATAAPLLRHFTFLEVTDDYLARSVGGMLNNCTNWSRCTSRT